MEKTVNVEVANGGSSRRQNHLANLLADGKNLGMFSRWLGRGGKKM